MHELLEVCLLVAVWTITLYLIFRSDKKPESLQEFEVVDGASVLFEVEACDVKCHGDFVCFLGPYDDNSEARPTLAIYPWHHECHVRIKS